VSFYTEVIARDSRFHSMDIVRAVSLLEPVTRAAVASLIVKAAASGIELMVTETFRSEDRQQELFARGATELRTVGVHHFGLACDLCKVVDGKPSWGGDWTFMVGLCAEVGLISGVNWGLPNERHSFIDADHVQRCTVAEQSALFAGTWYPDSTVTA